MTQDNSQPQEVDLDRTDVLPILAGAVFDPDVEDDAVRLDSTAMLATPPVFAKAAHVDFPKGMPVDLPSLAESVRSVEDRIARQNAAYETLTRSYEKSQEAEAAAFARASALAAELATLRTALEAEQNRSHEFDRALAEKTATGEAALARVADTLRQSERYQAELDALRQTVAAREANFAQIVRSLSERDAQLNALQREHAKVVPELEARSNSHVQVEGELAAARARAEGLSRELQASQGSVSALTAQVRQVESELGATRHDLDSTKTRAESFLEQLRTREWRLGFSQNQFRELDAEVGAAQSGRDALRAERDQLSRQVATLEAKLMGHEATIAALQESGTVGAAALAKLTRDLEQSEAARAELASQIAVLENDRSELNGEVAARERTIAEVKAAAAMDVQRNREAFAAEETRQGVMRARIAELEAEAVSREQGMAVLVAHLHEARRPLEPIEAELKRLSEEAAHKTMALDKSTEESRDLRAALERTRGALEEREFLIRRLEKSESNNAAVLGRIQTSIEKLGTASSAGPPLAPGADYSAELVRIDGDQAFRHALTRRTRIGRAASCELQIESSSVSRQHALILMGRREVIIEDLNSTNGVMVNGRRISRQMLNDGDLVMIGDIKFRLAVKQSLNSPEAHPETPPAG